MKDGLSIVLSYSEEIPQTSGGGHARTPQIRGEAAERRFAEAASHSVATSFQETLTRLAAR